MVGHRPQAESHASKDKYRWRWIPKTVWQAENLALRLYVLADISYVFVRIRVP